MNSQSSLQNLSLCVYIGNTSSLDDQSLVNYCSQFGTILSCSISNCPYEKRPFCDFRIIEFSTKQQLEYFVNASIHQIGPIKLDIRSYKTLLDNLDLLNIDRKLFIGPVLSPNHINTVVQFYKTIDPALHYCLSRQDKETYVLIEFSTRHLIRIIIQKKTIPETSDNQILTIHTAVHPKELITKKISATNNQYQICVNGLNDKITENILIDYFDKRARVIACHIIPNDPKCAIIEFENERFAQKLLDIPIIRLHGANLSLSKVSNHHTSISRSSTIEDFNTDEIDQLLEASQSKKNTTTFAPTVQNETFASMPVPIQQEQPNSFFRQQPSPMVTEPVSISSPDINECGWASPPRTVINHCLPVDQPPERLSSRPGITTADINMNSPHRSTVIETDKKPIKNVTNNILNFFEQFQIELDQMKDEYMTKFTKERTSIEHQINRFINDERITFNRFLYDHRRRSTISYDNKRK